MVIPIITPYPVHLIKNIFHTFYYVQKVEAFPHYQCIHYEDIFDTAVTFISFLTIKKSLAN
jgi:hypothetical protein